MPGHRGSILLAASHEGPGQGHPRGVAPAAFRGHPILVPYLSQPMRIVLGMARAEYGAGSTRQRGEGRRELRMSAGRDPATGQLRYVGRSMRLFYRSLREKRLAASTIRQIVVQDRR